MIQYKQIILMFSILISLVACGGGASDTDNVENAINDASSLVGFYQGSETVRLIRDSDNLQVDSLSNMVTISINSSGILSLSSSGGSSGQAQITNGRTFLLRADARTQFNGQCSSGTIFISGNVSESNIIGTYSSESIICGQDDFRVEGSLDLKR